MLQRLLVLEDALTVTSCSSRVESTSGGAVTADDALMSASTAITAAIAARCILRQCLFDYGATCFETNSTAIVRTMFVLYSLLIVGGIVFFVTVGLMQQ